MNEDNPAKNTPARDVADELAMERRAQDKLDVVRKWFAKADNDIRTAEFSLGMESAPYEIICFHAQQCAEKYLKGLLVFHDTDFSKTHIIAVLISMCAKLYPSIKAELSGAEALSVYAVESRYPVDMDDTTTENAAVEAISMAKKVSRAVLSRLEGKV
jgi:HEPN domain-containing protein